MARRKNGPIKNPGPQTMKALGILYDHEIASAVEFARLMWPDSEGWHHRIGAGHGVVRGRGMSMAGGSYLGRLQKAGWSTVSFGGSRYRQIYHLTPEGKKLVEAYRESESLRASV